MHLEVIKYDVALLLAFVDFDAHVKRGVGIAPKSRTQWPRSEKIIGSDRQRNHPRPLRSPRH